MGNTGKIILVFFVIVLVVLVIVIASVYPSEQDPKIWNSTQENDTEDLSMGAIGLAPNRGNANTGFDKTGKLKPKWG